MPSRIWPLFLVTVITTYLVLRLSFQSKTKPIVYSYRGSDFPSSWDIGPLEQVHVTLDDSVRYDLDTELGVAEWATLFPPEDGAIRLGPDGRPFGLSMFHELKCVDVIRDALATGGDAPHAKPHIQHCMDYLRQAALCRGDLTLQNLRRIDAHVSDWFTTYECKDWTAVYDAVAKNQETHRQRMA